MRLILLLFLASLLPPALPGHCAGTADNVVTVEGEVAHIGSNELMMADGTRYPLWIEEGTGLDTIPPKVLTEYYYHTDDQIIPQDHRTLAGVGYISRARLHLRNGTVVRVDILRLEQ